MRLHLTTAAAIVVALASPSFAQGEVTQESYDAAAAAIGEFELTDTLYQNLWCGSAFMLIETMLRDQGSTADADSALGFKDALFGKAATEAVEAGISEADFVGLSESFTTVLAGQTTGGLAEPDYAQDECVAAAQ